MGHGESIAGTETVPVTLTLTMPVTMPVAVPVTMTMGGGQTYFVGHSLLPETEEQDQVCPVTAPVTATFNVTVTVTMS